MAELLRLHLRYRSHYPDVASGFVPVDSVFKPGRILTVYRDSLNTTLRIFQVYTGPPATNYRDAPRYHSRQVGLSRLLGSIYLHLQAKRYFLRIKLISIMLYIVCIPCQPSLSTFFIMLIL